VTWNTPSSSRKPAGVCIQLLSARIQNALIVVPNLLLGIFGLPVTSEVWIRVVGVVVFNIGVGYWFAAKSEARAFFQGTVYSRSFVLVAARRKLPLAT
jgi:hypothetical protein